MSLSAVSKIYYVCLHYILILIASGRIVQSHDCYKGETRSKLDFLICGTNIFLQIPVPYVFFRDRFFFFFFNWRIPLSVFNSCAIFVVRPTKMVRNEGIIQFIKHTWGFLTDNFNCKHCNVIVFRKVLYKCVEGIFKTSNRNCCSWLTCYLLITVWFSV